MRKFNKLALLAILATPLLLTGCQVIGDIFKAGVWVGIIGVALVVGLVVWIIGKMK